MLNYSIIIPHRDIPQLLQRCLNSIPQHPDLEVIVVDDNSKPDVVDSDHFPGMERSDTTVIFDKSGKGAGRARNIGLEHAKGKWLLFADADDLYVDGMYDIISQWKDSDADVVYFKNQCVSSDDLTHSFSNMCSYNDYIDTCIKEGDERFVRLTYCVPWGKLYRRGFVERHDFRFDEVPYSNDVYFSFCTGYYARKIEVVDTILYVYTRRKESLSGTFCSKPGELAVRADVSFRIQKQLKNLQIDFDFPHSFSWYLLKLLKQDKLLFRYYWRRVDEAYPSKYVAFQILSKGKGRKFKVKLALYSLWIWLRPLSHFKRA